MRGTDPLVYSETTNKLRLGMLLHVLDLCELFFYLSVGYCCFPSRFDCSIGVGFCVVVVSLTDSDLGCIWLISFVFR